MILSNKKFQLVSGLVIACLLTAVIVYLATRKVNVESNDFYIKANKNEKLLIIMIDGVRYDYVDRDSELKGFMKLAKDGVKVEYMEPVFPSSTYPNWYTIVTGLKPENHGFINNYMFDEELNDAFLMVPHPNASHEHWWNKAEPIWITAEKMGKKVLVFNWDGCQVEINGTLPSQCYPYRDIGRWDSVNQDTWSAFNEILKGFQSNNLSVALLYYEPVDSMGHKFGPDSAQTKQAVRDIDNIVSQLLENIETKGLNDSVNVYVVSDHGMSHPTKLVDLENYMNYNDIKLAVGNGAFTMIRAVDKNAEKRIYKVIKNNANIGVTIYKKEEIPEEMGIKHNRLTLPLAIVANPGFWIINKEVKNKVYPLSRSRQPPMGGHGYFAGNFDLMRGITFAIGPAFKRGHLNKPIKQTDHYQVFCKILGLEPNKHDGSWSRVKDILL